MHNNNNNIIIIIIMIMKFPVVHMIAIYNMTLYSIIEDLDDPLDSSYSHYCCMLFPCRLALFIDPCRCSDPMAWTAPPNPAWFHMHLHACMPLLYLTQPMHTLPIAGISKSRTHHQPFSFSLHPKLKALYYASR